MTRQGWLPSLLIAGWHNKTSETAHVLGYYCSDKDACFPPIRGQSPELAAAAAAAAARHSGLAANKNNWKAWANWSIGVGGGGPDRQSNCSPKRTCTLERDGLEEGHWDGKCDIINDFKRGEKCSALSLVFYVFIHSHITKRTSHSQFLSRPAINNYFSCWHHTWHPRQGKTKAWVKEATAWVDNSDKQYECELLKITAT